MSEQGRRRERKYGRRESDYTVLCHELAVSVMCVHVGMHRRYYMGRWERGGGGGGGEVIRDRRFSYVGLPLSVRYVCSEMNAEGFL